MDQKLDEWRDLMRPVVVVAVAITFAALGIAGVSASSSSKSGAEPTTVSAKTCPEGYRLNKKNKCVQIRGSSGSF
jgi:hypothetical protein